MKPPVVAVVVLNFNGKADTLECVRSLAAVTHPIRLYVVDNGSAEPVRDAVLEICPKATVIENGRNLGFTGGNNVGCRRALDGGADYVLLLNNDTTVDPGFVEPLVRAMENEPRLGMATPKIYFYGEDRVFWAHGARVDRFTGRSPHIGVYEKDAGQYDAVREVERITGCAMFVRRELFERVGFLDERFFIYSEEADWCLRARRAGYRLAAVKDSVIWHKGHRDSGRAGRPFIVYLQSRNHLLMLRKNSRYFRLGAGPAFVYAALAGLKEMARYLFAGRLDCVAAIVRGWMDFARDRFGAPS